MDKVKKNEVEVIIPTLDEERTIGSIIERTSNYVNKILVVNGSSEDDTAKIAKEMGAEVIYQNGSGKGAALKQAFRKIDRDIIIIMDGDGSMRPEEIPQFVRGIRSGYDVVKGSRFFSKGDSEDITLIRRLGNTLFIFLVNLIWRSSFTDLCYGFMAFRRNAVEKLLPILRSNGFEIETEIIIKSKKLNLKTLEIPSLELRRLYGKSNLKVFSDGWRILLTIFREFITYFKRK